MYAWRQSHFPEVFTDRETMGDLGYVGTGMLTGRREPPGQERSKPDRAFNQPLTSCAQRWNGRSRTSRAGKSSPPVTTAPPPPLVTQTITALTFYKKGW
ncbi:hypothetical protein OV450_7225 [Actinobacteria bacterium OV450]|nr:hypothetical protein OV450_7225 [Actinobacteria bacterium OV450]